jgi:hypothetical protein
MHCNIHFGPPFHIVEMARFATQRKQINDEEDSS